MFDVSVVIVNWNTKKLLHDCVDSICKNTQDVSVEIIVVDNCSTDGSVEMLEAEYKDRVILIKNHENMGFAKANNQGFLKCRGRYICLVNSDTVTFERCLDRMARYMDAHPKVGMLGPKTLSRDGSVQKSCQKLPSLWNALCQALYLHRLFPKTAFFSSVVMEYFDHLETIKCDSLQACYLMVRREALEQVGPLDESYYFYAEDKDWCKRFRKANWENVFYPEAEAIHYGGESSKKAPVHFAVEKCKADFLYWSKHYGVVKNLLYRAIYTTQNLLRIIAWSVLFVLRPRYRLGLQENIKRATACLVYTLQTAIWRSDNEKRKPICSV